MDIQVRIKKIEKYFINFQIIDGVMVVAVNFPDKWIIPNAEILLSEYKVNISKSQNGLMFLTELSNGSDTLFDSVDFVIQYNLNIEAKSDLFKVYINKLKDMFAEEDIEKLKTLEFIFKENNDKVKNNPSKKNKKNQKDKKENKKENKQEKKQETATETNTATDHDIVDNNPSPMMDLVKTMVGE